MNVPITVIAGATLNAAGDRYLALQGGYSGGNNSTNVSSGVPVMISGSLTSISIEVVTLPAAGTSATYSLYVNGSPVPGWSGVVDNTTTSLMLTITNSGTPLAISPFDRLLILSHPAGSPVLGNTTITANFTSTNANEGFFTACAISASTYPTNVQPNTSLVNATIANTTVVMSTAGTLDNLSVFFSSAIPAASTYTLTVYKNGSASALFVDTGAGASSADTTGSGLSVSYAQFDTLTFVMSVVGTSASKTWAIGCRWTSTVAGEYPVFTNGGTPSASASRFYAWSGNGSVASTEALLSIIRFPSNISWIKRTVLLDTAPGMGKSIAIDTGVNGVLSGNTMTISDTNTQIADNTSVIPITNADYTDWEITPTGTPATPTRPLFSQVAYTAPTPSGFTPIPDMRLAFL